MRRFGDTPGLGRAEPSARVEVQEKLAAFFEKHLAPVNSGATAAATSP